MPKRAPTFPDPALIAPPSPVIVAGGDTEAGLTFTGREAAVLRDGQQVALGLVVYRQPVRRYNYDLPTLIKFPRIFSDEFRDELDDTFSVRSQQGRGQELRAMGWRAAPVVLVFALGDPFVAEVLPPFDALAHRPEDREFLLKGVAGTSH